MKQVQCPNCKSYKVQSASNKTAILGFSMMFLGSLLTLTLIGAIIGIPLFVIGAVVLITAGFVKGETTCCQCQFKFTPAQV